MVVQSVIGFSFFTLIITYFLNLFDAMHRRNVFALSLHGKTLGTADPSEYVSRIVGDNELIITQQQFGEISLELTEMFESHHFYPILQYFRFPEIRYGIPRILLITLDTISLFKSTLDEKSNYRPMNSVAANELWNSGISLLTHFSQAILQKSVSINVPDKHLLYQSKWRNHYFVALEKLQQYGVETRRDPEEGLCEYIRNVSRWEYHIISLSQLCYMMSMICFHSEPFPAKDAPAIYQAGCAIAGKGVNNRIGIYFSQERACRVLSIYSR